MQTERVSRWVGGLIGAIALVIAAAAITPALSAAGAQQGPPPGGAQGPGPGRGFGPGRGGPGRGEPGPLIGIPGADLTDAQRDQIKAIRDQHAEEMRPLADRAAAAHKAIADAIMATPVDQNQLRVAANEVGAAEADLEFARAQVEAEVLAVLTPAQREQMDARQKEMEARRGQGRRGGPPPAQ